MSSVSARQHILENLYGARTKETGGQYQIVFHFLSNVLHIAVHVWRTLLLLKQIFISTCEKKTIRVTYAPRTDSTVGDVVFL